MKNKSNSKKIIIAVIGAFVLCVGAFVLIFFTGTQNVFNRVTGLTLEQENDSIIASWDPMKCMGYRLTVQSEGGRAGIAEADTNEFVIDKFNYDQEYTIRVQAKFIGGILSKGDEETIYTRKPQKIETVTDYAEGFAKERFSLKASAQGELTYSSSDDEVASVDETGEVFMHRPGTAVIKVKAAETENRAASAKRVEVSVYPNKLQPISIDKEYDSKGSVVLKWTDVPYADEYILKKYSAHDDKYIKFGKYKSGKTSVKLAREAGKYSIEAKSDVHGTEISSKSEESVKVKAASEDAKSYGSIKVIDTIGSDDIETVTTISGSGSINNPQSMCATKDGYVVVFVTKSNSAGMLKHYSKDGKLLNSRQVGGLSHGNGCTYNPYADRVYVCPTYAGHKSRKLSAYDAKTLEATGSIALHNAPSGVAYDDTNNRYYMTASWRMYVTDSDFNVLKVIKRQRHERSQDVGAYNGVALSCIWTGGSSSYIDMYRVSDGAYIGSYSVPLGEIESVCVDDGHLVILINKGTDVIYRTKDRVNI